MDLDIIAVSPIRNSGMNVENNHAAESAAAHIVAGGCYQQSGIPSPLPPPAPAGGQRSGRYIPFVVAAVIIASLVWRVLR